ncbi:MAG: NifU family protein [Patescibacteria group bacterium]
MVSNLNEKIEKILNKLRPAIQSHGGDVKFVDCKNGAVKLSIKGSCVGCPMAGATFGLGVAEELKKIKGVKKIIYA